MNSDDVTADGAWGDFEYERSFIVESVPQLVLAEPSPVLIVQSYLLADDGYAVRVRLQASLAAETLAEFEASQAAHDDDAAAGFIAHRADSCFLTAKGPSAGGTRYEAERELDVGVGAELVRRGPNRIVKLRHSVWLGTDGWVIDDFRGANAPLVMAECERDGPVVDLEIPEFCHTEVTNDPRFGNEYLAVHPFSTWGEPYLKEMQARGRSFSHDFGDNLGGE